MRQLAHLSYSAFNQWRESRDTFFLSYLADDRMPREPQDKPAAIGSAFDASVKDALQPGCLENLLAAHVDSHNRDWAREQGAHALNSYLLSGAFDDLREIPGECHTEATITQTIDGVPLKGLIDAHWESQYRLILDWKVKGYCAAQNVSPTKGYLLCRDGWIGAASRNHNTRHKDCLAIDWHGYWVNAVPLELCSERYAEQLSIYAWLLGEPVGSLKWIGAIDELCCKPNEAGPLIRVAQHRAHVSAGFQHCLHRQLTACWQAIQAGHIFTELTLAESQERCDLLEQTTRPASLTTLDNDPKWSELTHRPKSWAR